MTAPALAPAADAPSRERRWPGVVRSIVLALGAAVGAVVLLAALAPLAGWHVVRLETGSMSPQYPAGSLLLAQDREAVDVVPGDVVTVALPTGARITHRVVSAEPAGDGARLVLRGDANETDDPAPYLVTRVGLVAGGIPFGAGVVQAAASPAGIVALSVLAGALVLWAWWPAPHRAAHRAEAAS